MKLWWKYEGGSLEEDLKPFRNDGDAIELSVLFEKSNWEIEIFIDPKPSTSESKFMDMVKDKNKRKNVMRMLNTLVIVVMNM